MFLFSLFTEFHAALPDAKGKGQRLLTTMPNFSRIPSVVFASALHDKPFRFDRQAGNMNACVQAQSQLEHGLMQSHSMH